MITQNKETDYEALARKIKQWGKELGFQDTRITDTNLDQAGKYLRRWLRLGRHGEMSYMSRHGARRFQPDALVPGTIRVVAVRMDYLPQKQNTLESMLLRSRIAYVSRYALGRDYHKVIRKRLQRLADRIEAAAGPFGYRAFVDSAPVMEKALAEKSGLGWIGKHTNVINSKAGSWFFLGELYTDLPLPIDGAADNHCGRCRACLDVCPTQAIVAPYELDARRCISYLTIELRGSIPEALAFADGQPNLWLRRLPACLPVEQVCPIECRIRIHTPSGPDRQETRRSGLVERTGVLETDGRQRNPADWLRMLAKEYRRGPRKCTNQGGYRRRYKSSLPEPV